MITNSDAVSCISIKYAFLLKIQTDGVFLINYINQIKLNVILRKKISRWNLHKFQSNYNVPT